MNVGELSEIYVFLKALGDGYIVSGDKFEKPIPNAKNIVVSIPRETEAGNIVTYIIADDYIKFNNQSINRSITSKAAKILFDLISSNDKKPLTILPDFIYETLLNLNNPKIKARSTSKQDIDITFVHQVDKTEQTLGFSIKSQAGKNSTLLNASSATNIIYKVINKNQLEPEIINNIDGDKKLIARLSQIGHDSLIYHCIENTKFQNNLILVDSSMPTILGELILLWRSTFDHKSNTDSKISSLIQKLSIKNPLNIDPTIAHQFYKIKMKRLLLDCALGLTPTKEWDGNYDANGGYIIVKSTGDLICYHLINLNHFNDYLFYNTYLDTPSMSRHKFGELYKDENELKIKLNFQIRFKPQKG